MSADSKNSTTTTVRNKIAGAFACGFGSGYAPFVSGTFGSLLFVVIWLALHFLCEQWLFSAPLALRGTTAALPVLDICIAILLIPLALWSTELTLRNGAANERVRRSRKPHDPGCIVIDEWAGMAVALVGVASNDMFGIGLAFILFRLFDIMKPWPVRVFERYPGAHGVVFDDLAAGALAFAVMTLLRAGAYL